MMSNGKKVISKVIRIFHFSKKFKIPAFFLVRIYGAFRAKILKLQRKKNLIFKFWGSKIEKKKFFS